MRLPHYEVENASSRYRVPVPGRLGAREDPDAHDSLALTVWTVARRLRHASRDALAPWDVTPAQVRAMGVLARHGMLRPGALAEHLHIAPRSGTEVVDALEERGLVARTPDPEDRRATRVALTERGNEVVTTIQAARAAEADRFFAVLEPGERAELARLLRRVADQPDQPDQPEECSPR